MANADGSGARILPDSVSGTIDWSPDGRRLLYVDDGRIYVTNEDWTDRALLVEPAGRSAPPTPAGRPTASGSCSRSAATRAADVWVMNGDGTGRRRLTRLPARRRLPGLADLVARRRAHRVPASGQPRRRRTPTARRHGVLTRFPEGIFPSTPAWSPDSRTIAFARLKLGRDRHASGLYVVDADDGEVQRLTREIDSSPSWSPDGRQIVFQRLTGFHISEITLMDRDGSNQVEPDAGRLVGHGAGVAARIVPSPSPTCSVGSTLNRADAASATVIERTSEVDLHELARAWRERPGGRSGAAAHHLAGGVEDHDREPGPRQDEPVAHVRHVAVHRVDPRRLAPVGLDSHVRDRRQRPAHGRLPVPDLDHDLEPRDRGGAVERERIAEVVLRLRRDRVERRRRRADQHIRRGHEVDEHRRVDRVDVAERFASTTP